MKSPSVPGWQRERFAASMARHRHRISVKSKGADLVARKLATKFGESKRERQRRARCSVDARAVRHKGNRFSVNRDPRAPTSRFLLSFSSLPLFYPLLPRAILSSRICDHQHAKWIKFLDYTFRSPFLYSLPIPIPGRFTLHYPQISSPSRIAPTVSQIVSPHLRISIPRAHYPPSVFLPTPSHSSFLSFFRRKILFSSVLCSCGRSFRIWRFYGAPMHRSSYSEYIDLPAIISSRSLFLGM